jgi:hypothetical protein
VIAWKALAPLVVTLALALLPLPGAACGIVYGSDWAFVAQSPGGWTEACGDEAMDKTALTLWPSSQTPDHADVLMYVTVSGKGRQSLQEFAVQEIARFKASSKTSILSELATASSDGVVRRLLHIANAPGGRDEYLAYIEGPASYFIVVLSADSSTLGQKYRPAFDEFVADFYPMERTHGG